MSDSISALHKVALFAGLTDAELAQVGAAAVLRRVAEDSYYFFQGDPAERIFVLVEGQVKLTQTNPDGQQILLRIAGPNTLFGGIGMTPDKFYPASAQAAEDSAALTWARPVIMEFTTRFPRLALNAMQLMSGQIQEFQDRYRQLATERVERRLARTLIRLAGQTGKKTEEGVLINLPLTRQDLAEMTGTTLYTVSRILSRWEDKGLVILGRERVTIRFPHGLVRIAEDLGES
jgi:CRP-like cAMP-binding protein